MISPSMGERYTEPVAEIYRDAELRILRAIADAIAKGLDAPEWESLQLARLQLVRKAAIEELRLANPKAAAEIEAALAKAYGLGGLSAFADVAGHLDPLAASTAQKAAAVQSLAAATVDGLASAQNAMLRSVDDIYRQIVAEVSASAIAGAERRVDAAQRAINTLLAKGLTGIETARGQMDLPTYVTMAVRTATSRAAIVGHLDTMASMGLDLVVIEPGPRPCDICDSWARKILTLNGVPGTYEMANLAGEGTVTVEVDDTLDAARDDGWGHPNDRCNISTYLPGVTDPSIIERPPWDQEGYEAQQQQRAIERQIRGWKTQEVLAITPERAQEAAERVDAWQQAQRDLLEQFDYHTPQRGREQIGRAL